MTTFHGKQDVIIRSCLSQNLSPLNDELGTVHICDWLTKVKSINEPSYLLFHGWKAFLKCLNLNVLKILIPSL